MKAQLGLSLGWRCQPKAHDLITVLYWVWTERHSKPLTQWHSVTLGLFGKPIHLTTKVSCIALESSRRAVGRMKKTQ